MARHPREDTIAALVAECLSMRELGVEELPFEQVCVEHPELVEAVRRGVELAESMPGLRVEDFDTIGVREGGLLADRYRLGPRIGLGAMGVVHAGEDLELGRPVAIKIINASLVDAENAAARFEREAAALAAVRHPSVVTIHDRGLTADGSPFLVMELLDGVPCSRILDAAEAREGDDGTAWLRDAFGLEGIEERSFLRQALVWTRSVAEGVAAAHAAGIHHRDVKPSNVFITRDGRAVLIDFGIAHVEDDVTLTEEGAAVGTPAYMAPEVLLDTRRNPVAQDVYGLSATLYHLVTLRPPYTGTPQEVLASLSTREPIPAARLRPGLPRDVQAVLDHGLMRNPARRYPDARRISADIEALLAFREVSVRPTSTLVRVGRRLGRSRAFLGAIAASVLIAGARGVESWMGYRADALATAGGKAHAEIPVNLGLLLPENRIQADENARKRTLDALDRLVNVGHEEAPARALRAIYLLDLGRREEAIDDLQVVAERTPGKFIDSLVRQVEALGDGAPIESTLPELPDPQSGLEHYLHTVFLVRSRRWMEVEAAAEQISEGAFRQGDELRLMASALPMHIAGESGDETLAFRLGHEFLDRVRAYEAACGQRTPGTLHMTSQAFQRQGLHGRALEAALEGIAMVSDTHPTLQAAGASAFQLGRLDLASEYIDRANQLVPGYVKTEVLAAKIDALLDDAEAAREHVKNAEFPAGTRGVHQKAITEAYIELELGLNEYFGENRQERVEAFAESVLSACARIGEGIHRTRYERYGLALRTCDRDELFVSLLADLVDAPLSEPLLQKVEELWPETLDDEMANLLGAWTASLSRLMREGSEFAGTSRFIDPRYRFVGDLKSR